MEAKQLQFSAFLTHHETSTDFSLWKNFTWKTLLRKKSATLYLDGRSQAIN